MALRLANELSDAAETKVLQLRNVKTFTVWPKPTGVRTLPLVIPSEF